MPTRLRISIAALALAFTAGMAAAADPSPTPDRQPRLKKLDLGAYGRVTAPETALRTLDAPRFEATIDVLGQEPRDLNETMAIFWRQWNLSTGSIYGKGINFTNQGCPTCVNILPAIEGLIKKFKKDAATPTF